MEKNLPQIEIVDIFTERDIEIKGGEPFNGELVSTLFVKFDGTCWKFRVPNDFADNYVRVYHQILNDEALKDKQAADAKAEEAPSQSDFST